MDRYHKGVLLGLQENRFKSFSEWLRITAESTEPAQYPKFLAHPEKWLSADESQLRSNASRPQLTAQAIAKLIDPVGWREIRESFSNGHKAYKDVVTISLGRGKANIYDAFVFIEKAVEIGHITADQHTDAYFAIQDLQKKHPCYQSDTTSS